MANYKETQIAGTQWQRCNTIYINNPYNGQATVSLNEETIADVGGKTYIQPAAGIHFNFDPSEIIPIIDAVSGVPTGTVVTGLDVYMSIYSLYLKHVSERDAAYQALLDATAKQIEIERLNALAAQQAVLDAVVVPIP